MREEVALLNEDTSVMKDRITIALVNLMMLPVFVSRPQVVSHVSSACQLTYNYIVQFVTIMSLMQVSRDSHGLLLSLTTLLSTRPT
jgi:hypothetical protein